MEIDFTKLKNEALSSIDNVKMALLTQSLYSKFIEEKREHTEAVALATTAASTEFISDVMEKMFELYHKELIGKLQK